MNSKRVPKLAVRVPCWGKLLHKWTHNKFIQIDMTSNYICHHGLPGNCLIGVLNIKEVVRSTISLIFKTVIKICSWKSPTKHKVKCDIDLNKLVTGSIKGSPGISPRNAVQESSHGI